MKYSSYEILIKYHGATVLNNQDSIKELYYLNKKLDDNLNKKMDEIVERVENNLINVYNKFDILDKKLNNYHMKFHKINEMIDIIISDEYTKINKTYFPMKNYDLMQDRFFYI